MFTPIQAEAIGFKKTKTYTHNQYLTLRFQKGLLELEFTFEGNKLVSSDLTMEEVNCMDLTAEEALQLDKIFNKPIHQKL